MKTQNFKLSAIASVALLAACGGGSGTIEPAVTEPVAAAPIVATPAPAPAPVPAPVVIAAPSADAALVAAKGMLAKLDALRATSVPTTGAANFVLLDGCYLNNGFTKAYVTADFDSDPLATASRQFDVGSTRDNIRVLAERT